MVAVETRERVAIASGVRDIETATPVGIDRAAASCGAWALRQVLYLPTQRQIIRRDHDSLSPLCGLIY
jgi:hypothetical protein